MSEDWARVMRWLAASAPATAAKVRPPAGEDALAAAERSFPAPWPDDLRRWYALHDGEAMDTLWRCTLPGWAVLSLAEMVEQSATYAETADDEMWNDLEPAPNAGENAFVFLPEFVPIAENGCGETLFVDLRPGPLTGCVTEYAKGDADTYGPKWPSVSAMLADLADSLERSVACDGWIPLIEDGELSWDVENAED